MGIRKRKRSRVLNVYGRRPVSARFIWALVNRAVVAGRGLSLIRAGDMVTLILARKPERIKPRVFPFLGIPNPPPEEVRRGLHRAIATADVLGVNELRGPYRGAEGLHRYLRRYRIRPRYLTKAYINDELYLRGYVRQWIRRHRPVLVGRAAPAAAQRLNLGLPALSLADWSETRTVFEKIVAEHHDRQLVLVGAGIPGRILCGWLKREGYVAVEIGHVMDALAHPDVLDVVPPGVTWRRVFKEAYIARSHPKHTAFVLRRAKALPGAEVARSEVPKSEEAGER